MFNFLVSVSSSSSSFDFSSVTVNFGIEKLKR